MSAFGWAGVSFPVVLLLLLAGCAGAERRGRFVAPETVQYVIEPWEYRGTEGRRVLTDHYEIHTTLRDARLIESLPQALEASYAYFQHLVPAPAPQERMPVYVFAGRSDWVLFTRTNFPQKASLLTRIRNGGYTEGSTAVIEYVAHQVTATIMTHEALHQYLHHCVRRRVPAWLNEGLAVLVEGQRWDAGGLRNFDPWFNPARRNPLADVLLRDEQLPLGELLRINAGHVVGGPSRGVSAYYGQVWALMLFLREGEGGKYAAGLDRLLHALANEDIRMHMRAAALTSAKGELDDGTALFAAFISDEIEAVDEEYVRFMRKRILGQR